MVDIATCMWDYYGPMDASFGFPSKTKKKVRKMQGQHQTNVLSVIFWLLGPAATNDFRYFLWVVAMGPGCWGSLGMFKKTSPFFILQNLQRSQEKPRCGDRKTVQPWHVLLVGSVHDDGWGRTETNNNMHIYLYVRPRIIPYKMYILFLYRM